MKSGARDANSSARWEITGLRVEAGGEMGEAVGGRKGQEPGLSSLAFREVATK